MKRIPKTVVQKKEVTYVFYVTDLLYWQVMILRYEVVKRTPKKVVVLDELMREKTFVISNCDGTICDTKEEALVAAENYLKQRKINMKKYSKLLNDSLEEIKKGKVRIIKPKAFKI